MTLPSTFQVKVYTCVLRVGEGGGECEGKRGGIVAMELRVGEEEED